MPIAVRLILAVTIVLATTLTIGIASAGAASTFTADGTGPRITKFELEGPGPVVADGQRYLVRARDGSVDSWDTVSGIHASGTDASLGLSPGCIPRDLRAGIVLVDCGEPHLLSARTLAPLHVVTPSDPAGQAAYTSVRDWERVGAHWLAGDQYRCDHPTGSGCPPAYLNWKTGVMAGVMKDRARKLDDASLAPVKTCGGQREFRCVADGLNALRTGSYPAVLARIGRPAKRLPDSYIGQPQFSSGTIAWIGAKAHVMSAKTSRAATFKLPTLSPGYEWATIAATHTQVVICALRKPGADPTPPVKPALYYRSRVPRSIWR